MPKSSDIQSNFTGGCISPRALGRFDLAKYSNSVKVLYNFLIYQLGGALSKPGQIYAAETKSGKVYLTEFSYSTEQTYVLEMGNLYFRFYANQGRLESGGVAIEVATPYLIEDILTLQFSQDADTMYITHPSYAPRKLQRTSATAFTLTRAPFVRGPFLDTNIGNVMITPSADTGAVTLTATIPAWGVSTVYVVGSFATNGGITYRSILTHTSDAAAFATDLALGYWVAEDFFKAEHVEDGGSLWRIKSGVVKVTAYTSGTVVTGTVQAEETGVAGDLATGPAATDDWAEGAFSGYRGWPSCVAFHDRRLYYGNTVFEPETFFGSCLNAYDNYNAGTSADDEAIIFEIASTKVNAITWLLSGRSSLQIGTTEGTLSASGTSGGVITPTDINITIDKSSPCSSLSPQNVASYLYYVQNNKFQVRELIYNYLIDSREAEDMNLLADHILRDGGGAAQMALQSSPNNRLWLVLNDGTIAVLTRNPKQEVMGWSKLRTGKDSKGNGYYESICIIKKPGADDEIWVSVKRNINGVEKRFIEYFAPEYFDDDWDANCLDASLTYDQPKIITGATNASPVVITSALHGFVNGDQVKIDNVEGMTELNGYFFLIKNATANTFELTDLAGVNIDGSDYGNYLSGGEVRKMVETISGLDHFNGETVCVQLDGGIPTRQQTYVVAAGSITLSQKFAVAHVGLFEESKIVFLKLNSGAYSSGQGKNRRVYLSTIRVHRSLGMKIGQDEDNLSTVFFGKINNELGRAPALYSGDLPETFDSWWSKDAEIVIKQTLPLPLMILSVIFKSETEEK
ncbi:MAG: ubiquitin-activating E1 FCCH domain-containing protein [Candidatus Omnitrophota bacterium]|jgi:hypothetical protein